MSTIETEMSAVTVPVSAVTAPVSAAKTADELGAALTNKQRLWADAYLSNGLNGAAAARTAKYTNHAEAARLLKNEGVAAYLQARLNESGFTAAQIRARLEYMVSGDMRDFLTVAPTERSYWVRADQAEQVQEAAKRRGLTADALDNYDISGIMGSENVAMTEDGVLMVCVKQVDAEVSVDWRAAEKLNAMGRIKKIEIGKDGAVKFELHDPMRGLELLGKAQKMFTDKVETEHSGAMAIRVEYGDE